MARKTSTPRTNVTTSVTVKPRAAETVAYHAHGLVDTEGHGLIGNVVRGWDTYSDPSLVQSRKAAHEQRKAELVEYFRAKLAQ